MVQICDSIVVKTFTSNSVLLGVGNNLKYYSNASTKILPWKLKGKIHGIDLSYQLDVVLVYGERQFILLNYDQNDFNLLYYGKLSDWISSGKLLKENKICLITGHLAALELEYDLQLKTCIVTNKSYCADKTTLYCSYILGDSWDDLVIFGGTAMNVIIWEPLSSNIVQRLSGNNGVTLSIDVNEEYNMVITTSDDRSLKIYNLTSSNHAGDLDKNIFFVSSESFIQSYGHTARVFQGKIIIKSTNKSKKYKKHIYNSLFSENLPYIVTVGEDSNLCVWNRAGQLLFRRLHHFGSPIWNLDYDYDTDTIFTTSADGNCKKYYLGLILKNNLIKCNIESIDNLNNYKEDLNKSYKLEKIAFLCEDLIIIGLTNQNTLLAKLDAKDWIHLENLLENNKRTNPLLKNKCSILKSYGNQIAIGAFNTLIIIKFDNNPNKFKVVLNENVSNHYIKSIFFLNEDEYLVCDDTGNCKLLKKNTNEQISISIQKYKDPWVTCAFKQEKYLLLSNRQGHLLLYVYESNNFIFKDCIKNVNGNFGVTNIHLENVFEKTLIFKTYGHDNTIKVIKLNKESDRMNIISRENIPVIWVEKLFTFGKEKYIAGFNSTNFVLWNKTYGELFNYNCGGGHRFWDCSLNFKENSLKLIFIKKGKMHVIEAILNNISKHLVEIEQHQWHIKECNIFKLIDEQFFISGGEDNIIKISKLEHNFSRCEKNLCVMKEMNQHISNIRAIAVWWTGQDFMLFSAGGRAQICVTKFNVKTLVLEEMCNFMLKSTDFVRNFNIKAKQIDFDPETRFMTIEVFCNFKNEIEIFAGCSDGYIRKFIYIDGIIQFVDGLFYNRCILHIKIVNNSLLISVSTDGTIKIWDLLKFSSNSKLLYEIKHHESGINAIDILENGNNLHIITGGDDQNIVFSIVEYDVNFKFSLIKTHHINFLHTAQVTGIKLTKDFKYFYSTSVDQTVCKYCLRTEKLTECISTCVADIKGLELLNENDSEVIGMVYGCGIESF